MLITVIASIFTDFFVLLMNWYVEEEQLLPMLDKLKDAVKEAEETGRIKRETLEKLEDITEEIKNFYYKRDKNKSSYKMIVDEELEKLRTTKM